LQSVMKLGMTEIEEQNQASELIAKKLVIAGLF
jgi:hypothetical protein